MSLLARKYLSPEEVSDKFGIPKGTLTQWRFHGRGPAYFKLGRQVRYAAEDLEEWLKSCQVQTYDAREESAQSH